VTLLLWYYHIAINLINASYKSCHFNSTHSMNLYFNCVLNRFYLLFLTQNWLDSNSKTSRLKVVPFFASTFVNSLWSFSFEILISGKFVACISPVQPNWGVRLWLVPYLPFPAHRRQVAIHAPMWAATVLPSAYLNATSSAHWACFCRPSQPSASRTTHSFHRNVRP